jgi:hypothetical protein
VPPGWEHPRNEHGRHIPLFDSNESYDHLGEQPENAAGQPPFMPRWSPEEATSYQVYENITEGTPVSPVFDSLDGMRDWLVDQGYSRRAAEAFCRRGRVPTFMAVEGEIYPDIESAALEPDDEQPS